MNGGGPDGGVPKTEPPIGGVTTCQYNEDATAALPAKAACTAVKTCIPYIRPYTAEQDAWYRSKAQSLMLNMSLSQKANQLRGTEVDQYNDIERTWHNKMDTAYSDTGGIREFWFRDASRGLNFAVEGEGDAYATAFPVSMARGASFDVDLEYKIAQAVGDEMIASGNTMILAPCVNILRHPLWGRAQETYGEDSFHLGRLGTAYVVGVQEFVASCAKHYAANNVENDRFNANALMDEQTLREIYGRHFEMMIRDGGMAGVMASYNSVNGVHATQNKHLLTDILRGSADKGGFDFKGLVLSDWWAMPNHITNVPSATYAAEALTAGLDMELGWNLNYRTLEELVGNMTIRQSDVDTATERVLAQKVRFKGTVPNAPVGLKAPADIISHYVPYNSDTRHGHMIDNNDVLDPKVGMSHIALSQLAAVKSMVLLKNDSNTLPIKRASVSKIAVLGATFTYGDLGSATQDNKMVDFTTTVRTGDAGSSRVFIDLNKSSSPYAGIKELAGSGIDVRRYNSVTAMTGDGFSPDVIVVIAGMSPLDEGEQYTFAGDRKTFDLDGKADPQKPESNGHQAELVAAAAATGKPTVLVLIGGSVITIPAINQLKAVVMAWYPGMDGGRALGKLLFGDANFSGKLPITWPAKLDDLPPFTKNATGDAEMSYYLGYRFWDKRLKDDSNAPRPQFAFGYGLSYTTFSYKNLSVPCTTVDASSVVDVTVDVTNDGDVAGEEIAFLFTSYPNSAATQRSVRELKSFRKVALGPHETKRVHLPLRIDDLRYFKTDLPAQGNPNPTTGQWVIEKGAAGTVKVMVGGSSDETKQLSDTFQVN